jgi:hypothetical protein
MKWIKTLNLFLVVCLLLLSYGCFGSRKIQTRTITETVIRIDTIIKIQNDTILKTQVVTIHDTAILESQTSVARSYFSTQKQKIVLELKGKPFDVPVTIYKSVKQEQQVKEKIPIVKKWYDKYIIGFFVGVILLLVWRDRKTLFAK